MKRTNLTAISIAVAASLGSTGAYAASCQGVTATVYVDGSGLVVGGPLDGQTYNGVLKGDINSANVIKGTEGNDRIIGGREDDLICGVKGDDFIAGGLGDDEIYGGQGDDDLSGGAGSDTVYGGGGADLLDESGGSVNDENMLYGGGGRDIIDGSKGNDFISGGGGKDTIKGGIGDDEIYGDAGADILFGNNGDDMIRANNIYLNGDFKEDYINCGKGNDFAGLYSIEGDSTPEIENCETIEDSYYSYYD